MCCRGCFVCVHEMFTSTKFALCVYNFRKRQMALRVTWGLQQVFEVLLPFFPPWVKFPVVKFLITPASFQTLALYLLLCLKQVLCWDSRNCCSLTASADAAATSHSAQRDLGMWHQTAPPWDAPVSAGLVQSELAMHWCPRVSLSEDFARLSPCRTPDCVFSLYHDPPWKTVCENITRRNQRGIIYKSWSKQKSCSGQCKSRRANPGCQGTIAARLLLAASSEPYQDCSTQLLCSLYLLIHTGLDLSTAAQQQNWLWFMVQARGDSEIHSLTWVCSLKGKEKQREMICMVAGNWQLI